MALPLSIFLVFLTITSSFPLATPTSLNCSEALALSSCITFVGISVSHTVFPSRHCCDDIIADLDNGLAFCMCIIAMKPKFNSSRIFSLPILCTGMQGTNFTKFCADALNPPSQESGVNQPPARLPDQDFLSESDVNGPPVESPDQGSSPTRQPATSVLKKNFSLLWWLELCLLLLILFLLCPLIFRHYV